VGVKVGGKLFLGSSDRYMDQSIGMNETNTFQLKCFFSMKIVCALEWALVGVRGGVAYSRNKQAHC